VNATDPTDLGGLDFFRGDELIADPYPHFDHVRSRCPVVREPPHGVVMVTGYEEAVSVYTNVERSRHRPLHADRSCP